MTLTNLGKVKQNLKSNFKYRKKICKTEAKIVKLRKVE